MMMDCDWNDPGRNPYTGTVAEAVARYDIPQRVRDELVRLHRRIEPDEVAVITNRGIKGSWGSLFELRDMHFGAGMVCRGPVLYSGWADGREEKAMVYCREGYCIIVPRICNNVSMVTYLRKEKPEPAVKLENKTAVNKVPECGTLALIIAGLLVMKILKWRKGD